MKTKIRARAIRKGDRFYNPWWGCEVTALEDAVVNQDVALCYRNTYTNSEWRPRDYQIEVGTAQHPGYDFGVCSWIENHLDIVEVENEDRIAVVYQDQNGAWDARNGRGEVIAVGGASKRQPRPGDFIARKDE